MKEDFKFFMPCEISKAKNSQGVEVMKIGGIASTSDKDSDDEILEPNGFDLSYFLKNGFINWNHQSKNDPSTVIGEPTKAEITKDGLYIEGELYRNSEVANQVWDLAKTLEKSSNNRRLGFSIEGKALERDFLDKKRITKAKITGVAITPSPKNPCTIMDIIKGEANGYENEYNDFEKKILEKNITKSFKYKNKMGNFVLLNKANIFSDVCEFTNDINKAKKITHSVFEKLNNFDMVDDKIKQEEIVKALSDLGIEDAEKIVKAGFSKDDDKKEEDEELYDDLDDGDEEQDDDDDLDDENSKLKKKGEDRLKKLKKRREDDEEDLDFLEKSFAIKQNELKALKQKIDNKKNIQKSFSNNSDDISKAFEGFKKEALETVLNSNTEILDRIDELQKGFEERMSFLENQPINGRKSVTTQSFIEKSFNNNSISNAKNELSISKNRQQISDLLLTKSGIEKGEQNDFYLNALTHFEATGTLSKSVLNDLYVNQGTLITN